MTKVVVVDAERCLACKSCMLECALAHTEARTLIEAVRAETRPRARLHVEPLGKFGVPLQCRHCQDAPCMIVCPADAIHRLGAEGPVLLDQDRCTGCRFCLVVCPYGVIDRARSGKAIIKCDLCIARTELGEDPACVSACPTHALQFQELDEVIRRQRREEAAYITSGDAPGRQADRPTGDAPGGNGPLREAKGTPKVVPCEVCGRAFAPAKLFEHVRARLPADIPLHAVCETCRRSWAASTVSITTLLHGSEKENSVRE